MKTLKLQVAGSEVRLDYDPTKISDDGAALVQRAREAVAKQVSSTERGAIDWSAFEKNLGRWLEGGFEGVFSLRRALAPADGSGKRTSLLDVRTMGTEQEVREIKLSGDRVQYNEKVASTKAETHGWPHLKLTIDQAKDGKGCVELVFGPIDVTDTVELARRGRVASLLEDALQRSSGKKLSVGVQRFDDALALAAKDDPGLAKYHLDVDDDVTISVELARSLAAFLTGKSGSSTLTRSIQTNVEVPLRKLGDVADTTIPALFGPAEQSDAVMLKEARLRAGALVDDVFRPHAAKLQSAYAPETIKLDKLRAVFTLAIYSLAKAQDDSKAAFPLLPKTGFGDLVREALGTRDKVVLYEGARDASALEKRLLDDAAAVRAKPGDQSAFEKTDRAANYVALFQPGSNAARWGDESSGYGRVDWDAKPGITGTRTGKPIQTTYDRSERSGLTKRDPKIVLEIRRLENPINTAVERLVTPKGTALDEAGVLAHSAVVAASQPGPERTPKRERV
ncbi:hypothetical protein L6R52_36125 [Myxococcota bacterium]|nr:hypothetical protein [Myxococcota bacterium]